MMTTIFSPFMFRLGSLALAMVTLAACQSAGQGVNPPPPAVAAPDIVVLRLAEAAEKAANSLDNISRVEQVRTPMPASMDDMGAEFGGAPPELMEPVTITWFGPLERIMQALASRAGYSYSATGAPPPVPLTVKVDSHQQPLIGVVKSAALQVSGKAEVVLDAGRRAIEVRYAPIDASPY